MVLASPVKRTEKQKKGGAEAPPSRLLHNVD